VQLFDTPETLFREVGGFLAAGYGRGEALLVVSTGNHWQGIAAAFGRLAGLDPESPGGRLSILDAETALAGFMRHGRPNRALFHRTIGAAVTRLAGEAGGRLRIYGEMVELLVRDGNFEGATLLEALWNELGTRERFTLFCGYSAAHFAGPDGGEALAAICAEHSHTLSDFADPLGHFLVSREHARTC
jgi:hypothetical protein